MRNAFLPNINLLQQPPLIVIAVGEDDKQRKVVRKKGYPAYHLVFCKGGSGILEIDDKKYKIEENSVFILKPYQPHVYYPTDCHWQTRWIVFHGENALEFLSQLRLLDISPQIISKENNCNINFNSMYDVSKNGGISSIYKTSVLLYSILLDISLSLFYNNDKNTGAFTEKLEQSIMFIQSNYNKNISLDDIALSVGVSKQYLCRLFKSLLEISPYEYLINYRLKCAKEFLSNKKLTIYKVSELSGFNNVSYFCSVFKKHENMTPNKFRKLFYMIS